MSLGGGLGNIYLKRLSQLDFGLNIFTGKGIIEIFYNKTSNQQINYASSESCNPSSQSCNSQDSNSNERRYLPSNPKRAGDKIVGGGICGVTASCE